MEYPEDVKVTGKKSQCNELGCLPVRKLTKPTWPSATGELHLGKPASGSKDDPGSQFPKFPSKLSHSAASGPVVVKYKWQKLYVHGGHKAKERRERGHH